jgi:hypothetical protein
MSLLFRSLALTAMVLICLVCVPASGSPIVIGFSEVINNSLCHDTDPVNSTNVGLVGDPFVVEKSVLNQSDFGWKKFHIRLQTLNNDEWIDSPETDGVSFNQPLAFPDWVVGVQVKENMTMYDYSGDWDVVRTNVPYDRLDFVFKTFQIDPGATLFMSFSMTDFSGTTWRLCQRAEVPEPSTLAMVLLGLAGLAIGSRRR